MHPYARCRVMEQAFNGPLAFGQQWRFCCPSPAEMRPILPLRPSLDRLNPVATLAILADRVSRRPAS